MASLFPDYLADAIDPEKGVKMSIDLSPETYAYLIATGIAIFALGGFIWHAIGSKVK